MATTPTDASSLSADYAKALDKIKSDSQYTAETGTFDENNGVAGRVNKLTSQANPLWTAAETRAKQQSASRGLLNSSIAAQAGQQAVIETATPIAQADASLYQQQQLANQQATNDASSRNAAAKTQIGMLGFTTAEQMRQFNENLDNQKEQFAQQLGMTAKDLDLRRDQLTESQKQFLMSLDAQKTQLAQQQSQFDASQSQQAQQFAATQAQQTVMANLDAATRTQLAQIEAQSKQAIQGSSNIAGAWGTMMQSINAIQNNANLDASTKTTLIQNNIASFQSFANFWKKTNGSVDVSDLLNFSTSPIYETGGIPGSNVGNGAGDGSVDVGDRGGGG